MASLFRPDPDSADEAIDDAEAIDDGRPFPSLPEFVAIVSDISHDGWHMAAVVGESANPDFYVRAVSVRWPFMIARPSPSNRSNDKPVKPDSLSPSGTTPARKLVVNWRWVMIEGSVSQLRFYVKRARILFRPESSVKVRLTLKESAWPRRRIVLTVAGNRVVWNPRYTETLESPPEESN